MSTLVFISDEDGENKVIYINGFMTVTHDYAEFECAVKVAKAYDLNVQAKFYYIDGEDFWQLVESDHMGWPKELPHNFVEAWNLTEHDVSAYI